MQGDGTGWALARPAGDWRRGGPLRRRRVGPGRPAVASRLRGQRWYGAVSDGTDQNKRANVSGGVSVVSARDLPYLPSDTAYQFRLGSIPSASTTETR